MADSDNQGTPALSLWVEKPTPSPQPGLLEMARRGYLTAGPYIPEVGSVVSFSLMFKNNNPSFDSI